MVVYTTHFCATQTRSQEAPERGFVRLLMLGRSGEKTVACGDVAGEGRFQRRSAAAVRNVGSAAAGNGGRSRVDRLERAVGGGREKGRAARAELGAFRHLDRLADEIADHLHPVGILRAAAGEQNPVA